MLRSLAFSLPDSRCNLIYVSDRNATERVFYDNLLTGLGVIPAHFSVKTKRQFRECVEDLAAKGVVLVVAIDEAHELSHDILCEIRCLVNFGMDSSFRFTLILVGEPQMRTTLRLRSLQGLFRGVGVQYHLSGMDRSGIEPYITHEVKQEVEAIKSAPAILAQTH